MTNKLQYEYYRTTLLQTQSYVSKGKCNKAKPLLLLAIFDLISDGKCSDNKIFFNKDLETYYKTTCLRWDPDTTTSIQYPYYYLCSDGYLHITYLHSLVDKPKTPSKKFLLQNVNYASFDNALWDMLQDAASRVDLRNVIINHFFKDK